MKKTLFENNNGKIVILHAAVIDFLEQKGFMNLVSQTNRILVRKEDNLFRMSTVAEAMSVLKEYVKALDKPDVYEVLVKGIGSYVSSTKLNLLENVDLIDDRDSKDNCVFYFRNGFATISKERIDFQPNSKLEKAIWQNRVIDFDYEPEMDSVKGQFESFCSILSKNDSARLKALKSFVGYMLHRNKLRGEAKAIILYDEDMGIDSAANGGTGKTLLTQAIGKCREVVIFDGKSIKSGSWFKNQRIELTTDVTVYDDLARNSNLDGLYSVMTSGIEVEKKRQQSFYINFEESPKIMLTSNYPLKGSGGSSERRRRYEFEVANYFSAEYTPEMEFGNRFFDPDWSKKQWNMFYYFMMECVREYLTYGLVEAEPINLRKAKKSRLTNSSFVNYFDENIKYNHWIDKNEFKQGFTQQYPEYAATSSHQITKWIDSMGINTSVETEHKSSGGKSYFLIRKKPMNMENHGG